MARIGHRPNGQLPDVARHGARQQLLMTWQGRGADARRCHRHAAYAPRSLPTGKAACHLGPRKARETSWTCGGISRHMVGRIRGDPGGSLAGPHDYDFLDLPYLADLRVLMGFEIRRGRPKSDPDKRARAEMVPAADHDLALMQRHVAVTARAAFSQGVRRPPNYAELLSTVWEMAQELIESVRLSDAPLTHKVAMLRDLTKLLPALDKAESRHRVHIGKRVVQDMTSQDLEAAVKQILAKKSARDTQQK